MNEKQPPSKFTPDNCTALVCCKKVQIVKKATPAGVEFLKNSACANCCRDIDEIARRRALPLVKGPDGLWRKYIGIKNHEKQDQEKAQT